MEEATDQRLLRPAITIENKRQLLVEGRDALGFFRALLRVMSITDVQIQNFGGINDFRPFLKAFRRIPNFDRVTSLGIVRDAETNPRGAFQSIRDALGSAQLPIPQTASQTVGHHPKVTVFLLPDAATPGMLETLCLRAVELDPVQACLDTFFDCVGNRLGTPPTHLPKARVQAYLSTRPKPGLLLGSAAEAGYWNWDSPIYDPVKQFLQSF